MRSEYLSTPSDSGEEPGHRSLFLGTARMGLKNFTATPRAPFLLRPASTSSLCLLAQFLSSFGVTDIYHQQSTAVVLGPQEEKSLSPILAWDWGLAKDPRKLFTCQ